MNGKEMTRSTMRMTCYRSSRRITGQRADDKPKTSEMYVVTKPNVKVTWPAWRARRNMSRPRSSVPKGYATMAASACSADRWRSDRRARAGHAEARHGKHRNDEDPRP